MGSRKRNRRRSGKKPLKKGRPVVQEQEEAPVEGSFEKRIAGKVNLPKNILIVCEGETEAAYFFALKKFLDRRLILGVEILPDLDAQNEDKGSGLSALSKMLNLALEKMQEKDYSEVWVVLDNDEGNAYKLDDASINKIRTANPTWAAALKAQQNVALKVREDEDVKERIRYFLDRSAYENFLRTTLSGLNPADYRQIITLTTKKDSFERFTVDRIAFFENWKEASLDKKGRKDLARIKVAFTAIAFEHWLLLHYEYNQTAFYNSREYYPYFDANNYLTYREAGQTKYFDKGYLLYKERTQFKAFFEQVEIRAIPNALFLQNAYVAPLLDRGLSYFEINPYCDVYHLIGSLINTEFLEIGTVYQIKTADDLNRNLLKDLSLSRNESRLQLSFQLLYQQPLLRRAIGAALSFVVYAPNGEFRESSPQNIEFSGAHIYRKGDQVEVEFDLAPFQRGESSCLYIDLKTLYPNKGKQLCYAFIA